MEISKNALMQVAFDAGLDVDESLRFDYSGRGMYGKACFGIVGEMSDLVEFVAAVTQRVADAEHDQIDLSEHETLSELTEFFDNQMRNVNTDSMGLSSIFYWPGVQVSA